MSGLSKIISNKVFLAVAFSFFLGFLILSQYNISYPDKTDRKVLRVPPPKEIKHFTFGFTDFYADSMWVYLLQYMDYCENEGEITPAINAEEGEGTKELLEKLKTPRQKPSRCHKGWVYQMADRITDLSPHFRAAYRVAGIMLSIVVDDREGARLLFEKGIKLHGDYWPLYQSAAYHYLFEVKDMARAADLLKKMGDAGGPIWSYSLAARLYNSTGRREVAINLLNESIKQHKGTPVEQRLRTRLKEIQEKGI